MTNSNEPSSGTLYFEGETSRSQASSTLMWLPRPMLHRRARALGGCRQQRDECVSVHETSMPTTTARESGWLRVFGPADVSQWPQEGVCAAAEEAKLTGRRPAL